MADIDLHNEYNSSGESVQDLFDRTEEGFFVPPYQRGYTWEEDNINQLFDDLVSGVGELSNNESATTFLGTTILTTLGDKTTTVKAGEVRAQPTAVQVVIDGQQRISTLALVSIQIVIKLNGLLDGLPNKGPYADLRNAAETFVERLTKLYTIGLGKGAQPPRKPKIIRAQDDRWTYDGEDSVYRSPIAKYIATFIRTTNAESALSALDPATGIRVRRNIELIAKCLDDVCNAHIPGTNLYEQFPVGVSIASTRMQEYVLGFTDPGVKGVVEKSEQIKTDNDYCATATYQLLLLTYYLLRRCGVNRLQPTREEWGFDMFQALNATGTPLTVLETFLPQVMQAESASSADWDSTPSREYMDEVRRLIEVTTTNEQKNRRTNELLGTFALSYEGKKLGNKFSEQRRWLTRIYDVNSPEIIEKREFVRRLARTADFYYYAWYMEDTLTPHRIRLLDSHEDGEFASLLIRYLRDAHSNLSAPILSRFHDQVSEEPTTRDEFIECAKACAAFFTLWRSANSTSGLDEIYRKYFRGNNRAVVVGAHNWLVHKGPASSKVLKQYFLDVLEHKGIADQKSWLAASEPFLLYTELKTICRFILFVSGHDRIRDEENPGLTKAGTKGTCPLLKLSRWAAKDCRSLEHVAPQTPSSGHSWDPDIYSNNLVQHVGNLILLPIELNNLASNKEWGVKYFHYCHLGERSQEKLKELSDSASRKGIVLSRNATKVLSETGYVCAVEPVLGLGESGPWDAEMINNRTQQIKALAWQELFSWLQP